MTELQKKILDIVDAHSGGIKFTELVTEVISQYYIDNYQAGLLPESAIPKPAEIYRQVESAVRDCNELNILEYGMLMGDTTRTKMFVCRPLQK